MQRRGRPALLCSARFGRAEKATWDFDLAIFQTPARRRASKAPPTDLASASPSSRSAMLKITELTFDAWGRRFFDRATVSLPIDAKVGLVGRNGVGKSTLFKLILGELVAGGGEFSLPKSARIGSVDQEHPATPIPLIDTVL